MAFSERDPVRGRAAPVTAFTVSIQVVPASPLWAESVRRIARLAPSGDQAIEDVPRDVERLASPEVSRRASPPATGTTQRCDGRGALIVRKLSWPTSKPSFQRSRPGRSGAGSGATNASRPPSGLRAICSTPPATSVMRRGSPPARDRTNAWAWPVVSSATKTIPAPSGVKRGLDRPPLRLSTRTARVPTSTSASSVS